MDYTDLKLYENPEDITIPFSDEAVLEDGFICDIIEESSIEDIIPDYILEKIMW